MKTFFKSICACLALVGLSVHAAPIVQSGWTTTGVPATARDAMGALAETNGIQYNTFGSPRYRFQEPDNQTFWLSNQSVGLIWSWDNAAPAFTFHQGNVVINEGITLGGVTRDTWPGGSGDTYNLAASTNYGNIVPDIASLVTNAPGKSPIYVRGYYSTNTWGNGWFEWANTSFATNYGTVFTNSLYGGQWVRMRPQGTNVVRVDWFGTRPMNSDDPTTLHASDVRITNAIAVAGNNSKLIWPNYGLAITNTINLTNVFGLLWEGETGASGERRGFNNRAPILSWMGTYATNVGMVKVMDSQNIKFKDMCFHATTPNPFAGGNSNNAYACLIIDQSASAWPQITTGIECENVFFQSRGTNLPIWYGVQIAPTSLNNCEDITFTDCYAKGAGYLNGSGGVLSTATEAIGFYIGNSANARGISFENCGWDNLKYGIYNVSGSYSFYGGDNLMTDSVADFYIWSSVGPITIEGVNSEEAMSAVIIGPFGVGASQGELNPVILRNNIWHFTAAGNRQSTTPIIPVQSSVNLVLEGNIFGGNADQVMFDVTNTASSHLTSFGNIYPTNTLPTLGIAGFQSGIFGERLKEGGAAGVTYKGLTTWNRLRGYIVPMLHPVGGTNITLGYWRSQAVVLNTNYAKLHIGQAPSALAAEAFVFTAAGGGVTSWNGYWGDDFLRRLDIAADPLGRTDVTIHSTNNQIATLTLQNSNSSGSRIILQQNQTSSEIDWRNGALTFQKDNTTIATMGANGTIAFTPTNPASAFSILATQVVVVATNLDLQSPALTATGYVHSAGYFNRSNSLANLPTVPRFPGDTYRWSSNGAEFIFESDNTATWTRTNRAGGGSSGGGYSGWETNTALANSFLSTNVLIASGGIHATQQNNTIGAILGTTAADNAPAGTYGEYLESKIASGSAVSLTTATAANITSISLTAGDWDVEGSINFSQGAATATATVGGINTTSATLPTDGSEVNSGVIGTTITVVDGVTLPRRRVNVSATTTVYLVGRATFSAGTVTGYGVINARRIR